MCSNYESTPLKVSPESCSLNASENISQSKPNHDASLDDSLLTLQEDLDSTVKFVEDFDTDCTTAISDMQFSTSRVDQTVSAQSAISSENPVVSSSASYQPDEVHITLMMRAKRKIDFDQASPNKRAKF